MFRGLDGLPVVGVCGDLGPSAGFLVLHRLPAVPVRMVWQPGGSAGLRSSRRHEWPGRCGDGCTPHRTVVLTWRLRGAAVVQAGGLRMHRKDLPGCTRQFMTVRVAILYGYPGLSPRGRGSVRPGGRLVGSAAWLGLAVCLMVPLTDSTSRQSATSAAIPAD